MDSYLTVAEILVRRGAYPYLVWQDGNVALSAEDVMLEVFDLEDAQYLVHIHEERRA